MTTPPPTLTALSTRPGDAHVYAVAADGRVWTNSWTDLDQPQESSGWSPLGDARFPAGARVVALTNRLNDRDLFAVGEDGRLYNTCWVTDQPEKQWRDWEPLGDVRFPPGATIAAVTARNTGDVAAAGISTDGRLSVIRFPAPEREPAHWSDWQAIDTQTFEPGASVAAASTGRSGDLSVFAIAKDGTLQTCATSWPDPADPPEPWGEWSTLGEHGFSHDATIHALRDAAGATALVVVDGDGLAWSNSAPAPAPAPATRWSGWSALGDQRCASIAALAGEQADRPSLFAIGPDGMAWARTWTRNREWTELGERQLAALAAVTDARGVPRLFGLAPDGELWSRWIAGWTKHRDEPPP